MDMRLKLSRYSGEWVPISDAEVEAEVVSRDSYFHIYYILVDVEAEAAEAEATETALKSTAALVSIKSNFHASFWKMLDFLPLPTCIFMI